MTQHAAPSPFAAPHLAPFDIGSYRRMASEEQPYVVAVIGAASGIGRAAAGLFGAMGCHVACLDTNEQAVGHAAAEIETATEGTQTLAVYADVADPHSVGGAFEVVGHRFGQVHAVVNCAGITGKTNIKAHDVDLDDFDRVCAINLRGALVVSQAVLPGMLKANYGRLLHVASIAGKDGNAGMTAYAASKAGLIGLVKSMAKDYADTGVTINALAPAVIRTPMVEALPQATIDYMTAKIPMGRCGELDEAAAMIAWICAPACSFTTGFAFDLTGGRATY